MPIHRATSEHRLITETGAATPNNTTVTHRESNESTTFGDNVSLGFQSGEGNSGLRAKITSGLVTALTTEGFLSISTRQSDGSMDEALYINNTQDSLFRGHVLSTDATGGIGYFTGAGGTATQNTSKSTGVTLNKVCGQITMNNANLVAGTSVTFTLTNSAIVAGDLLVLNHASVGNVGDYVFSARCASGSATIAVRNVSGGDLAEAVVIGFVLIKGVTA